MKRIFFSFIAASLFFVSCKKDSTTTYNSSVKADLSVEFDNIAGSKDLQLKTGGNYITASGDTISSITKLKYFVSNFVFTNVNGSVYTVPQDSSYFLVVEGDSSTYQPDFLVPEGEYNSVSFVLGVDSARSTMDASNRTGNLDVTGTAADMYWTWNSGYIFYKLEGTSPQVPATGMGGNAFYYHIGLYGGKTTPTVNNIKTITLDLTARGTAKVKSGKDTNIHLTVDVLKMFSGANTISIAAHPMVMVDPYSSNIANNFTSGMFRHDHTEN